MTYFSESIREKNKKSFIVEKIIISLTRENSQKILKNSYNCYKIQFIYIFTVKFVVYKGVYVCKLNFCGFIVSRVNII